MAVSKELKLGSRKNSFDNICHHLYYHSCPQSSTHRQLLHIKKKVWPWGQECIITRPNDHRLVKCIRTLLLQETTIRESATYRRIIFMISVNAISPDKNSYD